MKLRIIENHRIRVIAFKGLKFLPLGEEHMARLTRLYLPGCAHHIIQRGNNREACFYGKADCRTYLTYLKEPLHKLLADKV